MNDCTAQSLSTATAMHPAHVAGFWLLAWNVLFAASMLLVHSS